MNGSRSPKAAIARHALSISTRTMPDEFETFHEMKRRGRSPVECAMAAKDAGLDFIPRIRMLREVYGLSLVDAKEAIVVSEGWSSLHEYQGSLVPALESAFKALESE